MGWGDLLHPGRWGTDLGNSTGIHPERWGESLASYAGGNASAALSDATQVGNTLAANPNTPGALAGLLGGSGGLGDLLGGNKNAGTAGTTAGGSSFPWTIVLIVGAALLAIVLFVKGE